MIMSVLIIDSQYRGMCTISYILLNKARGWRREFMIFGNHYYEYFPDFNKLNAEPDLWYIL